MSTNQAPYLKVTWPASALANFGGYRLRRRPSRAAALPWVLVMDQYPLNSSYTPATVQAQHTEFRDYDAGWAIAGGQWQDGFDYTVTAINSVTGFESPVAFAMGQMAKQVPDLTPWAVCNGAPYLNFPLASVQIAVQGRPSLQTYHSAGRDFAQTRASIELPERTLKLTGRYFGRTGEDQLRLWRAAAASGKAMTVHLPRGDRVVGGMDNPADTPHEAIGVLTATGSLVESTRDPITATDTNVPCGIVLNGGTQHIRVPDNALINPGAGAFTIVLCAVFPNPAAVNVYGGKGDHSAAPGYWFMHDNAASINNMRGKIRGATAAVQLDDNSTAYFDGALHVVTLSSTGAVQAMYRDDGIVPVANGATVHGAVTIGTNLSIGSNNDGGGVFAALAPFQTAMYFGRVLTPAESQANARALLGYSGYRMAANPALLIDTRDDRTWKGFGPALTDLSAIPPILSGALIATPATRGVPWPLSTLDRYS